MRMRRRGFTLVELVVVMAIIAALVALLIPSLARARTLAMIVVCGSNQHQIATGLRAYASANAGAIPYDYYGGPQTPPYQEYGPNLWWDRLSGNVGWDAAGDRGGEDYITTNGHTAGRTVWHCPFVQAQTLNTVQYFTAGWAPHYSLCQAVGAQLQDLGHYAPDKWDGVPPANLDAQVPATALLADGPVPYTYNGMWYIEAQFGNVFNPSWPTGIAYNSYYPTTPYPPVNPNLHGGVMNVAFVDGHVEQVKQLNTQMLTGIGTGR